METPPETVIERGAGAAHYWRDLWRYRELFFLLAWRDLLVRYKQTAVGVAWAVLRPLATMAVFVLIFSKVAKLSSGDVPYPVLVFAGLLPWQFFSSALAEGGNSLLSNSNLISKVYFPRLIVPASSVVTALADFLIGAALLGGLMLVYRFAPDARLLGALFFGAILVVLTLGAALWLSALTVRYRDVRVLTPFVVQFGFFLSPVGYSSSAIPEGWRAVYSLNPLVGIIDGFRWALLRGPEPLFAPAVWSAAVLAMALFWSGAWYFRRTERSFADVI